MKKNLLIVHGGGPTAVMNASLYGALEEATASDAVDQVYGAVYGTGGILQEKFLALDRINVETKKLLLQTPGSFIGTSRDAIEEEDYKKMVSILKKHRIGYVLFNGGNGTMDTCGKLGRACREAGEEIRVIGIPKTIDNDLAVTDHSPGFGSAARYMAWSVKELCADVAALPIHVTVLEALGRNAGWLSGAAALAKDEDDLGPDFIYFPEVAFDESAFLQDVENALKYKKGIVVVASEGLKDKQGNPIVQPIYKTERAIYFGDVSAHLANLVVRHLGYKARSEKPGLLGRASIALQSRVDREEAVLAGRAACRAVLSGETEKMVIFERQEGAAYRIETALEDISHVMMEERTLPESFMNEKKNFVSPSFIEWCKPLIGEMPGPMASPLRIQ